MTKNRRGGLELAPWLALAVVGVAFAAGLFAAFFPGAHSVDTLAQVREGLKGEYLTAHPPLLSWMLGAAVRATGSPWPVLALQLVAFVVACGAVAAATRSWPAALLLLAIFALPPTWGVAITLWKDAWLATGLCVVVVGLLTERPGVRLTLLFAGAVGACLFRHNAVVVVGPAALFGVLTLTGVGRLRRGALALALVTSMVAVPRTVERAFDARPIWGLGPTLAWDLCRFYEDKAAHRRSPFREISRRQWKKACLDDGAKRIVNDRRGLPGFSWRGPLTANKTKVEQEWLRLVRRDPVGYLEIRWRSFRRFLGADDKPISGPFAGPWRTRGVFTPTDTDTPLYRFADDARRSVAETPLQRPLTWVVVLGALTAVAALRRARVALIVAGVLWVHLLSLFFLLPATGFRYGHVVVVGDALVAAVLLSARGRAGSSTAAARG